MRSEFILLLAFSILFAKVMALDVVCGADTITVTITADDKIDLNYDALADTRTAINWDRVTDSAYGDHPAECKAGNGVLGYTFGRTKCDPTINQVDDQIYYHWRLWVVVPAASFDVVARFAQACIDFTCCYNATQMVSASFMPTIGLSKFWTTATGRFTFTFNLYEEAAHTTIIGSNYIQVPDRIYGQIHLEVTTIGGLTAQVKSCFASESPDPSVIPTAGDYIFIDNFCAQNGVPGDPSGVVEITMQGQGQNAEFDFMSFTFANARDDPVMVYIHCKARACDVATDTCPRDDACKTVAKRSIDDEDDENTQTLTYGPIIMKPKQRICDLDNGGCDEICTMHGNGAVCSCEIGRSLADNARSCVDEIRVDLAVEQHENMLYVDATKVVGLMVLLLAAIFATVLITMSCRRSDKGKNVFQAV